VAHHKTLSDLRTAVRDRLDESTASFWTNAQLTRYINRAKDRVWNRVKSLNEDYFAVTRTSEDGSLTILSESYDASSFQIVAGTRDYTLPPDFSEMKLIECIESGYEHVRFIYRDLARHDMRDALEIADNQTPGDFFFDLIGERTMRIAPKSDTTLDLRITYIQFFADLSDDTDELTMPHPLYLAVEEYATSMALRQDRNTDSEAYEASGDKIIAEMFGAHHRQTQDTETATGYLEGW
jgi:hypothetical protein